MTEDRKPEFFYGYVVVVAAFCIQVVAWGMVNSYGIFFLPLTTEFGWLRATISGAASLCLLTQGFMSIIVGSLNDRFGPRVVMSLCGLFFGLGYLLMSQVSAAWQLYLFYGVIVGMGLSSVDVVLLSMVARWFVKKRGMMSGIVKVGTGVGMLIMPLVISVLISTYGWRNAYIIIGAPALIVIVSAAQFLRRDPGEMHQLAYGEEATTAGSVGSAGVGLGLSLREAIRTRQFWMICTVYLAALFSIHTTVVHIVPHAEDLGIPATSAASIMSIIGGASIAGRFIMGSAGDRIGNRLAMIVCLAVLSVALLWLQLADQMWMLVLFALVYGFAHGGFFALLSPTVASLFGMQAHGVIFGIVIFSGTIGGAIGPILAGHIFDISHSYQIVFLLLPAVSVIGLVLTVWLRPNIGKGGGISTTGMTRTT